MPTKIPAKLIAYLKNLKPYVCEIAKQGRGKAIGRKGKRFLKGSKIKQLEIIEEET